MAGISKKVVIVVIPPSVTELLAANGRLIPFHNDTYVKIEGVCIPLLDLRKVPEHITDENLVRLLVPGKALIFDIKRKLMSILCITKNKTNWSTTRQKALSLTCVTAPQNTTNSFDICYLSVRKKQNLSSF